MRTRILPLTGIVLSCVLPPVQAQVKVTQEFKTGHFYIQTGLQDVPAITEILEQFYDHLVEFFQEEPEEPIQVVVFDSQAEFEEELRSIDPSGAGQGFGGLYTSSTNTAYLWHEENEMRLRSKLLHEVVHAFRGNIGESGVFPADWYSEGIADYFALHCWAGAVLQTGMRPVISKKDWPAQALEALQASNYDLGGSLGQTVGFNRPVSWAIVHFLMMHHPERLRQLGQTVAEPEEAWKEVFGPLSQSIVDAYTRHLHEIQQPWTIVGGDWEECDGTIVGSASGVAMAVLKETPETFTAELLLGPGSEASGLVVGFLSPGDYHELTVREGGVLRLDSIVSGSWTRPLILNTSRHEPSLPQVLTVEKHGAKFRLLSQGKRVAKLPLGGQVGLVVEEGTTAFRVPEVVAPEASHTP